MVSNDHTWNSSGTSDKSVSRRRVVSRQENFEDWSFQNILRKLYAHKLAASLAFSIVVLASAAYTLNQEPMYEASVEILITKNRSGSQGGMDGLNDYMQPSGSDERRISDELAIMRTDNLRNRMVQFLFDNPILKSETGSDTLNILLPSKADRAEGIGPFATKGEVAGRLSSAVKFTNQPNSDIIDISVRSRSSEEAAMIANAYAREYYNLNVSSSRAIARNVGSFLRNQLYGAQTSLTAAEDSLRAYMQSQRIVSLDQESNVLISAMSTMEAQRDDVVVEVKTHENLLEVYRSQLKSVERSFSSHVSDALDPYIALLQQQIAQLQVNRDVAIAQNPAAANRSIYDQAVAQADSQIASLQRKLKEKTTEFINSRVIGTTPSQQGQNGRSAGSSDPTGYYTDLRLKVLQTEIDLSSERAQQEALDRILSQYDRKFSRIPSQYIRLAQLERTQQSRSKLFLMIQDNFQQAQIAEQSQFGNVQIIDPASPPGWPVSPRVQVNITVAVLLGLGLAIVVAFVLDRLDGSVKAPEDLEKKGFKILSVIPMIPQANVTSGKSEIERSVLVTGRKVPLRLVTIHSPLDSTSETYRSLRTVIQYSRSVGKVRSLLVVSALPQEGKSTTVVNLSVAFAHAGMKTLMLDADLRGPILHKLWNVQERPGLIDFLRDKAPLDAVIKGTSVENLFVLPAGSISSNPSEILGSDAMKSSMEILKQNFDMVMIDSPPVLAVTDAAVLSQLADAVLFVTSAKSTKLDLVDKGSEALRQVDANVIGYVLNEFDYRKAYGTYYNHRYYSQYHKRKEPGKGNV